MDIPNIKLHLTLSQLLQYYGLKPDKNGRLNCPFHEDKTPSLQVYYKTHTVYCFSSNCKTHGKSLDVIDFVMHKENLDKHEALLKSVEIIEYYQGKVTHQHKSSTTTAKPAAELSIPKEQFLQNMFTYFLPLPVFPRSAVAVCYHPQLLHACKAGNQSEFVYLFFARAFVPLCRQCAVL
jgi:DNA primase